MKKAIYECVAEDLSHLGGPMGSEYTTDSSLGLFETIDEAKKIAQKHYGKKPIPWTDDVSKENEVLRSEDLGWVMYHIRTRTINLEK